MVTDLLLMFNSCRELDNYLEIEEAAQIIGVPSNLVEECLQSLKMLRNYVLVPRTIEKISSKNFNNIIRLLNTRYSVVGVIPEDLSSARRLAKIRRVFTVVNNLSNIDLIDEEQVNFMSQSQTRRFIEIHFIDYVKLLLKRSSNAEKVFQKLGDTIEKALKIDLGVVSSSACRYSEILLPVHVDVLLYHIGFTKRERDLILRVYPLELLSSWMEMG